MWFHTMEVDEGWLKMVVSPAAMLKGCQLRTAFCEVVVMVSCEPLVVAVAEPLCTVMPVRIGPARSGHTQHQNRGNQPAEHGVAIQRAHNNPSVQV